MEPKLFNIWEYDHNSRKPYNPWEYEEFEDQDERNDRLRMEELANSWVVNVFPEVGDDIFSISKLHENVHPPLWISRIRGNA